MTIILELPENPKGTAQEKGTSLQGGRVHHYTKANVRRQREIYKTAIVADLAKRGQLTAPKFRGPVILSVSFFFHTSKKKDDGSYKCTKPDLDNSVKLLQDVLDELGFFEVGDQQVAVLYLKKKWTKDNPFISIHIDTIKEDDDDKITV